MTARRSSVAQAGARSSPFQDRYGPWAIVTGASEGIGRAIASELADRGLGLVLVARRADRLQALAAELSRRSGIEARVVATDLATPAGRIALRDAVASLDVGLLVAAAGFGTSGSFGATPMAVEREMLALNCGAVLDALEIAMPRLLARGRGGIVLLSSVVAFQGVPDAAHYAATKAWVQSLAEGLRLELAPAGIDVLASAPGPVHSGFAERAGMTMGRALTPEVVARATLRALGRTGTVRPGWLSKLLGWSLATAPRALRTRILGRVMQGMTGPRMRPAGGASRGGPATG